MIGWVSLARCASSAAPSPGPGRLVSRVGRVGPAVALVAGLAIGAGVVSAATLQVPGQFASVNAAVAAAAANDTILVGPGTYETEVDLTVPLTILSSDGPGTTTLDGLDSHRIFNDVTADLTVEGITFTRAGNGSASTPESFYGGAIAIAAGVNVTVDDCVFISNKAGRGAGIQCLGTLTVRNSRFENNGSGQLPVPGAGIVGSGIMGDFESDVVIEDCVFINNLAFEGGAVHTRGALIVRRSTFESNWGNSSGGAIYGPGSATDITVEDCVFRDNRSSKGGGLASNATDAVTITGCEFTGNYGGQNGGAVNIGGGQSLLIDDCTFVGNTIAENAVGGGGAVYIYLLSSITIQNSYFRGNEVLNDFEPMAGGGAILIAENSMTGGADIVDCTFVENTTANGRGAVALVVGTGSSNQFPRFLRCIFAYNTGGSLIQCGIPGGDFGNFSIDCSVVLQNTSNVICGASSATFIFDEPPTPPIFCDTGYDTVCEDSVAWNTICGPMGGLDTCGPCVVPTLDSTWGRLKNQYRPPAAAPGD